MLQYTLFHKGSDGIWHRCIRNDEKERILRKAHYGIEGEHYVADAMACKVWQACIWWPTTQQDAQQ